MLSLLSAARALVAAQPGHRAGGDGCSSSAVGVRAAVSLPIDAVPDVTNVQVQIITAAPALSPVEVEQYVTVPVERAMAGLPKSTEVRSISKYGVSVVTVAFDDGTDIYWARQLVNERMREAQEAVPAQYGKPEMGPISSGLGEVYQFVLRNEHLTLMELEEQLDWYLAPQLRMVPGIVEVNSFGGEDRQYQVVLEPGPAAGHRRVHRAGHRRAAEVERQRGRRLHRAQPRTLRHRHRRPGEEPRRPEPRRHRRHARRACPSPSPRSARCASARGCGVVRPPRMAKARWWSAWR